MGIRREIYTDRSAIENVPAVVLGVKGAPPDTLGRLVVTLSVPRLLQFAAPSVATPIYVVDAALRAVRCPFPVRHPLERREVGLVTRSWSIECDLKECNSVKKGTLSTAGVYSLASTWTQFDTREILLMNS